MSHCVCKKVRFTSGVFPGSALNQNVRIAYITAGKSSKQPILLLHGNGGVKESWIGVMKGLARKGYYVIAADRRGTGDSGAPETTTSTPTPGLYAFTLLAADQQQLIQFLNVRNPVVVGHSGGARIAEQYYHQYATDPLYSASQLILLAPAESGLPIGIGALTFRNAITAGSISNPNLPAIASAFQQYAINVNCSACTQPGSEAYAKLSQNTYKNALKTTWYAYNAINIINTGPGGIAQDGVTPLPFQGNFVPGGTIIPSENPVFTGISGINTFGSSFVGTIAAGVLTIAATPAQVGTITVGNFLDGAGIPTGTTIVSGSGNTWTLSNNTINISSPTPFSTNRNAFGYAMDQIRIPTLVMGGNQDLFVIASNLGLIQSLIPGNPTPNAVTVNFAPAQNFRAQARVVEVIGAPHFILSTNVSEVVNHFDAFIKNKQAPCKFSLANDIPHCSK